MLSCSNLTPDSLIMKRSVIFTSSSLTLLTDSPTDSPELAPSLMIGPSSMIITTMMMKDALYALFLKAWVRVNL